MEEQSFVTWQIHYRRYGAPGGLALPFWVTKNTFLEYHATTRKPTMMQKEIITFNPTYLTKVTNITSILKFLNTESLVAQVSNTKFNIQNLPSEPNRSSIN